ncbi:MAG: helix-turn-helix domain-containing protein [Halioglobus sp.]
MSSNKLLEQHGLFRKSIRNNTGMVTAKQVHQFLKAITASSGDPAFCWRVGWELDHRKYPLFAQQLGQGLSLGELLADLSLSAEKLASATRFELHISGEYARFTSFRLYKSGPTPSTDAFAVSALVSLLKRYVKRAWNPAEVSLELADLRSVPQGSGLKMVKIQQPSQSTIQFPTAWLIPGAKCVNTKARTKDDFEKARSLIDFLASALHAHLAEPDLTAAKAAKWIGSPLREINHSLKPQGITLAQLIDDWRKKEACQKLQNQELSIAETGASVGYPDATSFSRVFRRWTKMSPRDYRKSAQ